MENKEEKDKKREYYFQKLIEFCKAGDLVQVTGYVKLGYSIKLKSNLAIATVAKYGHVEILKYIFSKTMTEDDIHTSISMASEYGKLPIIDYVYSKNKLNKELIQQSLMKSIQNKHYDIILYWKEKKVIQEEDKTKLLEIVIFDNNIIGLNFLIQKLDLVPNKNKIYQLANHNNSDHILNNLDEIISNYNSQTEDIIMKEKENIPTKKKM